MNIIRDKNQDWNPNPEISMIPLLVDWKISRCNIVGCKNKPTTIVTNTKAGQPFGMCENHFQEASNTPGEYSLTLEF